MNLQFLVISAISFVASVSVPFEEHSAIPITRHAPAIDASLEPEPQFRNTQIRVGNNFDLENRTAFTYDDLECLAQNIYFEARGESRAGQIAVAMVTLNRVASESYPNTICEVVRQQSSRGCQFSWYCDQYPDVIRDYRQWDEILEMSMKILEEGMYDITDGAVYYHADYVDPPWSRNVQRTVMIDAHIFYREA